MQDAEIAAENHRAEIFELLETLLDLIQQGSNTNLFSTDLVANFSKLAQDLLPVYSASQSASDKALLRSLLLLDKLLSKAEGGNKESQAPGSFLRRTG